MHRNTHHTERFIVGAWASLSHVFNNLACDVPSLTHKDAPLAPHSHISPSSSTAHTTTCPIHASSVIRLSTATNRTVDEPTLLFFHHRQRLRIQPIEKTTCTESLAIPIQRLRRNASHRSLFQAGGQPSGQVHREAAGGRRHSQHKL